jgi:hypothetical protein
VMSDWEMTPEMELAALEGWSTNRAVPITERLQAAHQVINELRAEVERLKSANDDLNALFELQYTRMTEASALWRAEAPEERRNVMPDLGALLTWLMERDPNVDRCPSCEHSLARFHHENGCWFACSLGRLESNVVCSCSWSP